MRRALVTIGVVVVALFGSVPVQADVQSASQATIDGAVIFSTPPPTTAPIGVSPDVFFVDDTQTYILLTTSNPPIQYSSKDGVNWVPTDVALPQGFDWSIVREGPSAYRLYFAEINPSVAGQGPPPPCTPGSKRLRYAVSSDLRTWTVQPNVLLDDVGCGVPHVMKTRDGRYFLYFNKRDPVHGIYVATSTDGLSWQVRDGLVGGDSNLVDPAPIEMPDGTFLMVGSTTGQGGFQELQLLRSSDGVTWSKRRSDLYSAPGASVLDPSIELIDGRLRVWFGYAPGGSHANARIASGVIVLGNVKVAKGKKCTAKGAISASLTCKQVKGKWVWSPLS